MRLPLLAILTVAFLIESAICVLGKSLAWDEVWRSEAAQERISLEGRAKTKMLGQKGPRNATAHVRAAYGKIRMDYSSSERRWSLIGDGSELIKLDPEKREAKVLRRPRPIIDPKLAERNYEARIVGQTMVAGRPTEGVEIVGRGGKPVVRRLWLDRETGYALKRERYNASGVQTSSTEFQEVKFGVKISPEIFTMPEGWQRIGPDGSGPRLEIHELEQQVGFSVQQPRFLPPGYVFNGGYTHRDPHRNIKMAELRYTDGLKVLSVFQRERRGERNGLRGIGRGLGRGREMARGRGRQGAMGLTPSDSEEISVAARGGDKVARHVGRDRVVLVVGDALESELTRIAKSVD